MVKQRQRDGYPHNQEVSVGARDRVTAVNKLELPQQVGSFLGSFLAVNSNEFVPF